ncbi:hypothetical protein Ahy_B09g095877 isoform C [Arachis hypogaea]|uniref:Transcription factor Spt20 n=1 Tax=Arachis hypogaea TaxID=3818 RepID=A0A444XGU8_ARAHY|nr:hypothetical protein Ahy_B09g095877 isoform C [Arachis hypogaea]
MGVSFKVSKTGTRFRSKPLPAHPEPSSDGTSQNSMSISREPQSDLSVAGKNWGQMSTLSIPSEPLSLADAEASFTLNLFPDGYSIGKPFENEIANHAKYQDFPKLLHPYDRSSESLFLAIESGHLPADILDDIPVKYVDGALICEVRDFRRCASENGAGVVSTDMSPVVNKVCLKMSLENIVKDIPSITDKSWTYGDLMEVESKILKAVQPKLHLDPTPKLDRLCESRAPTKLNLNLGTLRRKRLRHIPEFAVTSNNEIHGRKVCTEIMPESSNSRLGDSGMVASNAILQQTLENPATQNFNPQIAMALRPKTFIPDSSVPGFSMLSNQSRYQMASAAINQSGASPASQDAMISYADNTNSNASIHAKRDSQHGQTSPLSNLAKRMRHSSAGVDTMQQQPVSTHSEALQGSDMNWQNPLLPQQAMTRGIQYVSSGNQKFSQKVFEGVLNQDQGAVHLASGQHGIRLVAKEEQFEMDKLDGTEMNRSMQMETSNLDSQQLLLQQRLPQAFMRPNFPQTTWNAMGQHMEKEAKKEDQVVQKRKSIQSPRLSSGALPHSPLSSKSGELSNGSVGPSFGQSAMTAVAGASQKEKISMASVPAAVGTPPLTSNANDSAQRQHQAQLAAKRRSNSLPKTPAMNGVGSPASVGNGVPLNANSPAVGTPAMVDQGLQNMLERFSKIELVTTRLQLNLKKNKSDDYPIRKQNTYSPQHLSAFLANPNNNEGLIEETSSLSKSLIGGSMNVCKMRALSFCLPERVLQGNVVSLVPRLRIRMIMAEKPSDGTVAMHYGDIDEGDFLASEEHLPTLPNTHCADLLAKQFCSQMAREGYMKEDDRIQIMPNRVNFQAGSQSSVPPNNSVVEMQQYGDPTIGQSSNEFAKPASNSNASLNLPQNLVANPRMLPPGNPQALQMSQGLLSGVSMAPRPQQLEAQALQQQQQQLQQHTLIQQQNPQFQRSMILGTNQFPHLNAIGQNSNISLGNHMLSKSSPLQIQMLQQQQQQNQQPQMQRKMVGLGTTVGLGNMRNNIVGLGPMGNPMGMGVGRGIGGTGISAPMTSISSMGNMGQSPMNLNPASNISNAISQRLRSGSITPSQAEMLASKLRMTHNGSMLGSPQSSIAGISGSRQIHPGSAGLMLGQSLSRSMNTLPRAVGPMGPPSPQQMSQRTPMSPQQMSSGALHALSAGNPEACPASPQLSSQTLGSVSSIANSPMDMQGVNKSNSVNNAQ